MKYIETALGCLGIAGIVFYFTLLPGAGILIGSSFFILAIIYILKSFGHILGKTERATSERFIGFLAFGCLSLISTGVMFNLLALPGRRVLIIFGVMGLLITTLLSLLSTLFGNLRPANLGLFRFAIFGGLGLAFFFAPKIVMPVRDPMIHKFVSINRHLEASIATMEEINKNTLENADMFSENKLRNLEEIRKVTDEMVTFLENKKEEFISLTGGYKENASGSRSQIIGARDFKIVYDKLISEAENGHTLEREIRSKINDYTAQIKKLEIVDTPEGLTFNLTPSAEEDPIHLFDPRMVGKNWSELQFKNLPTHSAIMTLSHMQRTLLHNEALLQSALKFPRVEIATK